MAKDLGTAMAHYPEVPSVSVNSQTWEVVLEDEQPEARYSPGHSEGESCDWGGDEEEAEVVEATPASSEKIEDPKEAAGRRESSPVKVGSDKTVAEAPTGNVPQESLGDKAAGTAEGGAGETDKTIIEAEAPAPKRPKWLRFGSAQIHILQAIAAADAANWNSLQQCIKEQAGTGREKSHLVLRLEQLADRRQESRAGALRALEEHQKNAKDVAALEQEYQQGLSVEASRLEMYNPVGPRSTQPLITNNRLDADIEAGVGIWKARRDHRARERAAKHRKEQSRGSGAAADNAGTLVDVPADERGETVDDRMKERAREEVRSFRKDLRAEAGTGSAGESKKTHQRDSDRRRKIKRDKYRAKVRAKRTHDDADRDSNHAIAHCKRGEAAGTEARSAPGALRFLLLCVFAPTIEAAPFQGCMEGQREFDLRFVVALTILIVAIWALLQWKPWERPERSPRMRPSSTYKVGGRRKVKFKKEDLEKAIHAGKDVDVPFLGGPNTARALSPAGSKLRFSHIQGALEWEQESLALMLDRYVTSTKCVYQSQLKWWNLFCLRRGIDPIRVHKGYDRSEEQIFLDFLVHCSSNEQRAPGTVKLRLAAVRSYHLTLGLPDPTAQMPRLPLALAGIKRRYGTKERRRPVTPAMLAWIGEVLGHGKRAEAALIWAAITFGFFFLLRASEYLDVGYADPGKGMKGMDVLLKENGSFCKLDRIPFADEVVLTVRGSKTDIYNKGESRNHFASSGNLCPVKSAINLFRHFPQRYRGGSEDQAPLFRAEDGKVLPRSAVTSLLEAAAKALGMPEGDLGTPSLRFGGASAIWASYGDSQMVKRWGRWSSDSFQTYTWDARKSAQGVADRMSKVDLTPT